ncbi:MAG: LVIVD repeat-containing protein [Candidatus Sifarchaeia archaeon]
MLNKGWKLNCILALVLVVSVGFLACPVSGASTGNLVLSRLAGVQTGDAYDVYVDDDIAYVTCGYSGLKVFNVSNPSNPFEIAHVPSDYVGGQQAYAHQLFVDDNLLYIGDGRGGLKIVDCTNPTNPEVLVQYSGHYAWDVEVVGDVAFVSNGFMGSGDRLTIVNVTNSTAPALVKSYVLSGDGTDLELVGNLVFVTTGETGFIVLDVSNHSDPVQVGQYVGESVSGAGVGDLEIVGDFVFLTYWGHNFEVLNISDVSDIGLVTEFSESSSGFSVYIERERDLAFLCDFEIGLVMLNISDPTQLTEITRYADGGKPCRIHVMDDIVYMTDQDNGFVILEIRENHSLGFGIEIVILALGIVVILVVAAWIRQRRMVA